MHVVYASNKNADQSAHLRIVKSAIFGRILERKYGAYTFLPKLHFQDSTRLGLNIVFSYHHIIHVHDTL